jgi:hypothetical protein
MKHHSSRSCVDPAYSPRTDGDNRRDTTRLRNTITTTTMTPTVTTATKRRRRTNISTWTVTLLTAAAVATSTSPSSFFTTTSSATEYTSTTLLVRGEDTESHQLRAAANSHHQQRVGKLKEQVPPSGRIHPPKPLPEKQQMTPGGLVDRLLTVHKERHESFLEWCHESLGISSSLVEIAYFEYYDFIKAMDDRVDIFCEDCLGTDLFQDSYGRVPSMDGSVDSDDDFPYPDPDEQLSVTDYPMIPVRGLMASQDVEVGQILISIPHRSLWSISNIVDADPVLAPVMGRKVRELHGWNNPVDEIPLLAVALLYHVEHLGTIEDGTTSPHGPYLRLLLQDEQGINIKESIPHLWDSGKLRHSATPAVRKVAKGIKNDVVQLYDTIVLTLIEEHPDLFAHDKHQGHPTKSQVVHRTAGAGNDDDEHYQEYDDELIQEHDYFDEERSLRDRPEDAIHHEWMYSLDRFHWAFALVNSRHWHLPIPSQVRIEKNGDVGGPKKTNEEESSNGEEHYSFTDQEGPPASMPTDEWLAYQRELQRQEEELESLGSNSNLSEDDVDAAESAGDDFWPSGYSFLAPVADLLNFGPPCTRGRYNQTTNSFEIIATCPFRKGQEITFWYTDACEDVFVANYGFTMPMMVPKCATEADKVYQLNVELLNAYTELDRLDQELDRLLDVLHDCHCDNQTVLAVGPPSPPTPNNRNNLINRHDSPQPILFQKRQEGMPDARSVGGGRPQSINRKTGNMGKSRSRRSDKGRNDAKHAIRGGRRSAGSSPKGVLRRAGNGEGPKRGSNNKNSVQSRKSEF